MEYWNDGESKTVKDVEIVQIVKVLGSVIVISRKHSISRQAFQIGGFEFHTN